jgi:periplasmic protein CpxP/Spy
MRFTISHVAPAALALILTFSLGAHAQTTAAANSHQAKVEERIRDMYATLRISKAQDTAWNAFAQVMLDNAQAMEATLQQNGGDRSKLVAPQILDNYAAISAQHAQNAERLSAAFGVLYAGLSPEQKQAADEMFRNRSEKKAEEQKQTK